MILFQQIINQKMNTITADELMSYSRQFNIPLSREQAKKVADAIRGKNINIFDANERMALIKKIAGITSPETAKQVNSLFQKFVK